jgi:acyl-CoA thioester hydrolase
MPRFRTLISLRWSDMDAYGHVNNVEFLRLLEEGRVVMFFGDRGPGGTSLLESGIVVARAEIEYLRPLEFRPEPVAVDMWITQVSGASFDLGYEVLDPEGRDGAEPALYARAESTLVPYDLQAQQPRRMSETERISLKDWMDGPVPWRRRR